MTKLQDEIRKRKVSLNQSLDIFLLHFRELMNRKGEMVTSKISIPFRSVPQDENSFVFNRK